MFDVLELVKSEKVKTEFFRHQLLEAARHGTTAFQNALNKINNLPCVRESDGHVTKRFIMNIGISFIVGMKKI